MASFSNVLDDWVFVVIIIDAGDIFIPNVVSDAFWIITSTLWTTKTSLFMYYYYCSIFVFFVQLFVRVLPTALKRLIGLFDLSVSGFFLCTLVSAPLNVSDHVAP